MMTILTKYTLEQYNKAIELKGQGYGSQRIANILRIKRRGAIEDWINKGRKPYYFSEKRILACNSIDNIKRMRAMNKLTQPKAVQISAELRTKRLPKDASKMTKELAYILGVVIGDGHVSVSQRRVILSATDEDFVYEFKKSLEKWSGFKARFFSRYIKPSNGIKRRKLQYVSYIDSKEASLFLKKFNLYSLLNESEMVRSAFLKGFFDSEGYAALEDIKVQCSNINRMTIILVKKLLNSLSIDSRINFSKTRKIGNYEAGKMVYILSLYKQKSVLDYYNKIGFSIGRKQRRLEGQVNYIKEKMEDKMTEETSAKVRTEDHTVFVGSKPFMNPQ